MSEKNVSNETKIKIAQEFKKLMLAKAFEKITVNDITKAVGITRVTFYYHFNDKFDLLNWIYYNEVIMVVKDNLNQRSWDANLKKALININNSRVFYKRALHCNNGEFRRYMHSAVVDLFSGFINDGVGEQYVDQEDVQFVSKFMAYGVVGMVIEWIEASVKHTPDSMMEYIRNLIEDIKMIVISGYLSSIFGNNENDSTTFD